jgi:RND family efflux transporter MFP subunit
MNHLIQPGVGMKTDPRCFPPTLFVLLVLIGCDPSTTSSKPPATSQSGGPIAVDRSVLEAPGRTQIVPGRKGTIAPVPLHPVIEVLVAPGDRVKTGQVLVKLDADEARAEVRAKRAALDSARLVLKDSRRYLQSVEKIYQRGASSDEAYQEAQAAALKAGMNEQAAEAAWESAQAELEHYTVTASIDGVVSWLNVNPGMVSRPGTTIWGEILDLSEIDVRCELTPGQADRLSVGQPAEVCPSEEEGWRQAGRVALVGITADEATGLVPVLVRLANPKGHVRCGVPVRVRFDVARSSEP